MITNRKLVIPGAQLEAKHKGTRHTAHVDRLAGGQPTPAGEVGFLVDLEGGPGAVDRGPYKSISAAAMAVTGSSANGWRFWSLVGGETHTSETAPEASSAPPAAETPAPARKTPARTPKAPTPPRVSREQQRRNRAPAPTPPPPASKPKPKPKPTTVRTLNPTANQRGLKPGEIRMFCDCCMAAWLMTAEPAPTECPKGHAAVQPVDFTADTAPALTEGADATQD